MGAPIQFDDPTVPFDAPGVGFDGGGSSGLPTVTLVAPNSGPDTGATPVTITGTNFGTAPGGRFTASTSGFATAIFEITPNTSAYLNRIAGEGATMLRTDAYWRLLQPTNPGNKGNGLNTHFDASALADLDAVVNGAHTLGIHVILQAGFSPTWSRAKNAGLAAVATAASTDLFSKTAHGLSAGDPVLIYGSNGSSGITNDTTYYVIASGLTANAFKVSATSGGSTINITGDETGLTVVPTWGDDGNDKVPPTRDQTGYGDYAYFVWFLADRYGSKVTLEMWNEWNISTFWKQPASTSTTGAVDSPDAVEYAKMLKAGHIGVKTGIVAGHSTPLAAHPEVLVITGGTSPASGAGGGANIDPRTALAVVLANSVDNFDHVAHHPYQWQYNPTGTQDWNAMHQVNDLWAQMKAAGRSDADIWASEVGIISRPNDSGTDPASENAVGGYVTGAPGGSYDTSGRAITYTLAAKRAQQYLNAWMGADKFDATVQRQYTGPFCVFKMNDTAAPGTGHWANDEDHYGSFEGPGFAGPAKPHETVWSTFFTTPTNAPTSQLSVTVGGAAATIVSNTDTTIVINTPPHVAGTVNVVVTTAAGSSAKTAASKYTYTHPSPATAPVITALSPSFGPTAGGTTVVATGTGMLGMVSALFGTTPATFDPPTLDTTLILHAPPGAPGVVDVRLTNAGGQSGISGADQYTYVAPKPPLTRVFTLYARDQNYKRVGQIEDYTACTFLDKWLDKGTFTVSVPFPSLIATALLQPQAGIIVEVDGTEVFSGPGRGKLRKNEDGDQELVFSGVSDDFWLWARAAHPMPGTPAPPYYQQLSDVRTGNASTVIAGFVNANLGTAAIAARRIPALSLAPDPIAGGPLTGVGRWQVLGDLITQLALAAKPQLGFQILQSGDALVFSVVVPTDRSATVVFSAEAGTLGNFDYERVASNANYIYAVGAGSGAARIVVEDENGGDIVEWGRVEEILNRNDLGGPITTMTAPMTGQHFPPTNNAITVRSIAGFKSSGQLLVDSDLGWQLITYTGTVHTGFGDAFTGCTGGSSNATMTTGHQVVPVDDQTGQLEQAIVAELVAQTDTFRTDLNVIDTTSVSWPADYQLGDIVSVVVDGVTLIEQVRAMQVDLGPNGDTVTITPSVSSPTPKQTVREQALFSLVRDLLSRVGNLERNQ